MLHLKTSMVRIYINIKLINCTHHSYLYMQPSSNELNAQDYNLHMIFCKCTSFIATIELIVSIGTMKSNVRPCVRYSILALPISTNVHNFHSATRCWSCSINFVFILDFPDHAADLEKYFALIEVRTIVHLVWYTRDLHDTCRRESLKIQKRQWPDGRI